MKDKVADQAICCFCNTAGRLVDLFCLVIYPPAAEGNERSQTVYCHGGCLDRVLHPDMFRHPDLLDD
jgi:hypothetical protein